MCTYERKLDGTSRDTQFQINNYQLLSFKRDGNNKVVNWSFLEKSGF